MIKAKKAGQMQRERKGAALSTWRGACFDEHFAGSPDSKTDWSGTGVEPDVRVEAAAALETAVRLAESKMAKKQ